MDGDEDAGDSGDGGGSADALALTLGDGDGDGDGGSPSRFRRACSSAIRIVLSSSGAGMRRVARAEKLAPPCPLADAAAAPDD